jgi:hypothetical protein
MKKVILHWTSSDGGFDWFEKEYFMDEINYESIIDEYYSETKSQADALSDKWEIDGNPDPLYLNFTIIDKSPWLFKLIDNYMEDNNY